MTPIAMVATQAAGQYEGNDEPLSNSFCRVRMQLETDRRWMLQSFIAKRTLN